LSPPEVTKTQANSQKKPSAARTRDDMQKRAAIWWFSRIPQMLKSGSFPKTPQCVNVLPNIFLKVADLIVCKTLGVPVSVASVNTL
jgi:hypothetical protein